MSLRYSLLIVLVSLLSCSHPVSAQNSWHATGPRDRVIDMTSAAGKTYVLTSAGLYVSSDDNSWQKIIDIPSSQLQSAYYSVVVLTTGEIFLFSYNSYEVSSNGGTTWKHLAQSGFSTRKCIADNLGYLYAGQNDPIKFSRDKGVTWVESKQGTTGDFFDIAALYAESNGNVYAGNQGITGGSVYKSMDHGQNWILLHKENMKDVLAITVYNGSTWIAYSDRLMYSDDGINWNTAAVTTTPIISLLFTGENDVFAGTSGKGLLYSKDRGVTWDSIQAGIQGTNVTKLLLSPQNNVLAGTDSGLFVQGSPNVVEDSHTIITSFAIYPNPAQDKFTVAGIKALTNKRITLYDELGKVVSVTPQETDRHSISFNTQRLNPGTYFIKILSDNRVIETHKLLIAK